MMSIETMIAPETLGLRKGAQAQGYEYAVRREDHAWLYDGDMNGMDTAWEPDPENATWTDSAERALDVAHTNGLTSFDADGEETLASGLEIVCRPWFYEEDYTDSLDDTPLEDLDFTKLEIGPEDFEQE